MKFIDRAKAAYNAFKAPAAQAPGQVSGSSWIAGPAWMDAYQSKGAPSPAQRVESYKSIAYACSTINQNAVASVPLRLYCDASRGGRPRAAAQPRAISRSVYERLERSGMQISSSLGDVQEITAYPLLDTLRRPTPLTSPLLTQRSLFALIVAQTDVVGEAWLKRDGEQSGPPQWLWPLASQHVVPQSTSGPVASSYSYFGETYRPEQLLSFRNTISLRSPYAAGFSPAYAAAQYLGLEDEFLSIQTTLLGSIRPSIFFAPVDSAMPPRKEERERLEKELNAKFARGGSGGAWVSDGSFKPYPISYSPQDLAGLQISNVAVERIANCFGVPVALLSSQTNLANLQASQIQHGRQAVEPRCSMIAETLTALAQEYDPRLFFAFDSCVPEDEVKRSAVAVSYANAGILTPNEIRAELGYEPIEGGDKLRNSSPKPEMKPQDEPKSPDPTDPAQIDEETES